KVLKGKDEDLARRLRDVLNAKPQTAPMGPSAATPRPPSLDPKAMGDKSYAAGYLNDALRYYRAALESNPEDHEVQLKLGRTYNMLRQDSEAFRYFEMARASPEPGERAEANRAWHNLRPSYARFRISAWVFPLFSSRWHEEFTYGQ